MTAWSCVIRFMRSSQSLFPLTLYPLFSWNLCKELENLSKRTKVDKLYYTMSCDYFWK